MWFIKPKTSHKDEKSRGTTGRSLTSVLVVLTDVVYLLFVSHLALSVLTLSLSLTAQYCGEAQPYRLS